MVSFDEIKRITVLFNDDIEDTLNSLVVNGETVWVEPTGGPSISLSVDNPVIMAGETATLTALVCDGDGLPCEGVEVSFSSDIPNTVYQTITNNNGMAQMTYDSQSAGDVTFTASTEGLSDSTIVEDCMVYTTQEYSNTGNGSNSDSKIAGTTFDNTVDWECSFDFKKTGKSCRFEIAPENTSRTLHLAIGASGSNYLNWYCRNGQNTNELSDAITSVSFNNNTYYHCRIVKTGTTVQWYFGGNLIKTQSGLNWLEDIEVEECGFTNWSTSTVYAKNIKIKKLKV